MMPRVGGFVPAALLALRTGVRAMVALSLAARFRRAHCLWVTNNVVGTPPLIAPEALHWSRRSALDLFALGALAYFLLTGRDAYPARPLSDSVCDRMSLMATPRRVFPTSLPPFCTRVGAVDERLGEVKLAAFNAVVGECLPADAGAGAIPYCTLFAGRSRARHLVSWRA